MERLLLASPSSRRAWIEICLSLPAEAAEALLTAEITRKTARYEQHAQVQQVDYSEQDGKKGYIRPKVVVKIV